MNASLAAQKVILNHDILHDILLHRAAKFHTYNTTLRDNNLVQYTACQEDTVICSYLRQQTPQSRTRSIS